MKDLKSTIEEQNATFRKQYEDEQEAKRQEELRKQAEEKRLAELKRIEEEKRQKREQRLTKIKKAFKLIALAPVNAVKSISTIKARQEEKARKIELEKQEKARIAEEQRIAREKAEKKLAEERKQKYYSALAEHGTSSVGTIIRKDGVISDFKWIDERIVKQYPDHKAYQETIYTKYGPLVKTTMVNGKDTTNYSGFILVPGDNNTPDRIVFVETEHIYGGCNYNHDFEDHTVYTRIVDEKGEVSQKTSHSHYDYDETDHEIFELFTKIFDRAKSQVNSKTDITTK